jgi:hypothetical protein
MNDIVSALSAEPGQRFPSESGRGQTSTLLIRDIPANIGGVGVAPARAGGLSDLERAGRRNLLTAATMSTPSDGSKSSR